MMMMIVIMIIVVVVVDRFKKLETIEEHLKTGQSRNLIPKLSCDVHFPLPFSQAALLGSEWQLPKD